MLYFSFKAGAVLSGEIKETRGVPVRNVWSQWVITYRSSAGNGLLVSVCITHRARASRILPVPEKSAVVFSHPGLPPI